MPLTNETMCGGATVALANPNPNLQCQTATFKPNVQSYRHADPRGGCHELLYRL